MMKILILLLFPTVSLAQDSLLTYSRILNCDSVTRNDLFDRAMVWCSKSFADSKDAINIKDKESGLIGGKVLIKNYYKVPRKKDSAYSFVYTDFYCDWLIEVKDSRVRLSIENIMFNNEYPVHKNGKPPVKIAFRSEERTQQEWDISQKYFLRYIDALAADLHNELKKDSDW